MNKVTVVLSNPDTGHELPYTIDVMDHALSHDWQLALEEILSSKLQLEKPFCFLGFPKSPRTVEYLCDCLNKAIFEINTYDWNVHGLEQYIIEEWFSPDTVRFGNEYPLPEAYQDDMLGGALKHGIMNRLHNHFERLQGTVENPSKYFINAPHDMRRTIGKLNTLCHELENQVSSQRKHTLAPEWTRPAQITSFNRARRYNLTTKHRQLFKTNGFDREFGTVYMHWAQIGKTLFEVWRDEDAPILDKTTCEAITHLQYYSGEFDVEWGQDIKYGQYDWHDRTIDDFTAWLIKNNYDPTDVSLGLGYLPIAKVNLLESFGTTSLFDVWEILSHHLNIKRIESRGKSCQWDYTWRDQDV